MLKLIRWFRKPGHPDTKVYIEPSTVPAHGRALALVNHGRWIAHCPRPDCANAVELQPQQGAMSCEQCLAFALVHWPADAEGIWTELLRRPNEANRNWYPDGHEWALRAGLPTGQSVAQLREEYEQHVGAH